MSIHLSPSLQYRERRLYGPHLGAGHEQKQDQHHAGGVVLSGGGEIIPHWPTNNRLRGGHGVQFLDTVSTVSQATGAGRAVSAILTSDSQRQVVTIKEGYLVKRGQGRQKSFLGIAHTGLKNLKKRYFMLTSEGLSYHKEQGADPICRIRPENILGVEMVDDAALDMEVSTPPSLPWGWQLLAWLAQLTRACPVRLASDPGRHNPVRRRGQRLGAARVARRAARLLQGQPGHPPALPPGRV